MDILGTNNSFAMHELIKTDAKYSWSNTTRSTMKLNRTTLQTEDDGKLVSSRDASHRPLLELTSFSYSFSPSLCHRTGRPTAKRLTSSRTQRLRTSTMSPEGSRSIPLEEEPACT